MKTPAYGLLGPLEVISADGAVSVPGPRQGALLAILILHAREVVSTDRLIDLLYRDAPPAGARKAIAVRVSQLRKLQKRTAMRRVPKQVLLRNIAIALGNTRSAEAVPALVALLDNHAPLVRAHAAWALAQIEPDHPALAQLAADETDAMVRAEL